MVLQKDRRNPHVLYINETQLTNKNIECGGAEDFSVLAQPLKHNAQLR